MLPGPENKTTCGNPSHQHPLLEMAALTFYIYADMCCTPTPTNAATTHATTQSRCRTQSNFNPPLPTRECRSLPTLPALQLQTMRTGQKNARRFHPTRCLSCLTWVQYVINLYNLVTPTTRQPQKLIVNVCSWMDCVL